MTVNGFCKYAGRNIGGMPHMTHMKTARSIVSCPVPIDFVGAVLTATGRR